MADHKRYEIGMLDPHYMPSVSGSEVIHTPEQRRCWRRSEVMDLRMNNERLKIKTVVKHGGQEYLVSTVSLPVILGDNERFETMVFPWEDGDVSDWGGLCQFRYATKEEAEGGHDDVVAAIEAEGVEQFKEEV